jgi:peptide chain release factor 1
MRDSIRDTLESLKKKEKELNASLSTPEITNNIQKLTSLNKELSEISNIVEDYEKYLMLEKNLEEINELLLDKDMKDLAQEEKLSTESRLSELETEIMFKLLPKDEDDAKDIYLEIRAGAGGDEAAIFVGDLYRMYSRFSERNNWKVEKVKEVISGSRGYKEIIAMISGEKVYEKMKFESGVHRVQRVPETESQGRIHTSTSTVAILPKVDDINESDVNQSEIRIDTFRASGPGGQSVNTTDSAVRITHIPTGIVVSQQDEKSQHKNKAKALSILTSKIHDFEKQKLESERASKRKNMVGTGDRSEKIRTYNYPQGRVTEHRIKLTVHNLETVIDGELNEIVDSLITQSNAEKLLEIEEQSQ